MTGKTGHYTERHKMQTEKEFKELAQAWARDKWEWNEKQEVEMIIELMWRSYNQGIEDYVRQDS